METIEENKFNSLGRKPYRETRGRPSVYHYISDLDSGDSYDIEGNKGVQVSIIRYAKNKDIPIRTNRDKGQNIITIYRI